MLFFRSKKSLLSYDKRDFLSDAFLSERDAHCVRDAGFARDARLRRMKGTHRITYHSAAASLITYTLTYSNINMYLPENQHSTIGLPPPLDRR